MHPFYTNKNQKHNIIDISRQRSYVPTYLTTISHKKENKRHRFEEAKI